MYSLTYCALLHDRLHSRRTWRLRFPVRALRPVSLFFVSLRTLKGLKAFFAYGGERFVWPSRRRCAAELETRIEGLVMGRDYDSMTLGKEQQRKSQWLEAALASIGYRLYEIIAFN